MADKNDSPLMRKFRAIKRIQLRVALLQDCLLADDLLDESEDDAEREQSTRRMFVRSFVSWVEGDTYVRNDILMDEDRLYPALTSETKRDLKNDRAPLKLRARHSLRGYMEMFSEFGPDFFRSDQDQAWAEFDSVIKMRNRITHPSDHKDLIISDEDVALVRRVEDWYDHMTEGLFGDDKG